MRKKDHPKDSTSGAGAGTGAGATPPAGEYPVAFRDPTPAPDPAAVVAAYLHAHPDFLNQHPDVLADLHVSHIAVGGVVSLVERQIRLLRGQLQTERARLAQLIARAREYEAFSTRLHALVLALISAPDLARVQAVLAEDLTREFSAQAVTLRLFPLDAADPRHDRDPVVSAFRDFLERRHALCGALDEAKNGALFGGPGATGEPVRCAALIPVRAHGCCGVLAIGAADPDRFRPEMGTDLLDRLGEVVSRKLEVLPVEGAVAAPVAVEAQPAAAGKPRRARARKAAPEGLSPEAVPPAPVDAPPDPDPSAAPKAGRRGTKQTATD